MPYDTYTADRIRRFLEKHKADFFEKTMFGGLCFMVDNKMFCGVHFDKKKETDLLMARIGEDAAPAMLKRKGCHPHGLHRKADERLHVCNTRRLRQRRGAGTGAGVVPRLQSVGEGE
jgi:hypothetical protein